MALKKWIGIALAILSALSTARASPSDDTSLTLPPGAYGSEIKQVEDGKTLSIGLHLSESGRYALLRAHATEESSESLHSTINRGTYTRIGSEILLNPPDFSTCNRRDEAQAWKGGIKISAKMFPGKWPIWHLSAEKFSYFFPVDDLDLSVLDDKQLAWILTPHFDEKWAKELACLAPRMSKVVATSYRDSEDDLSGCSWTPVSSP